MFKFTFTETATLEKTTFYESGLVSFTYKLAHKLGVSNYDIFIRCGYLVYVNDELVGEIEMELNRRGY